MAARKTTAAPVRVWTYAARVHDEDLAREILFHANRYYNRLVEIERKRHARFVSARRSFSSELAALEDAWETADAEREGWVREVKRARQGHWQETGGEKRRLSIEQADKEIERLDAEKKRVAAEAKELRAAFKALLEPANVERKRRSEARSESSAPRHKSVANALTLTEMLSEDWPEVWKEIARSDADADRESKAARATCALATGTYLGVEDAFARAKVDSSPRPPRFHRFDGTGRLRVQLRDATLADILAGTPQCTMRPMPSDGAHKGRPLMLVTIDQQPNNAPRRGVRQQLELDIKTERRPRWRQGGTVDDAKVTWATLVMSRVGRRMLYEFQLTMEHPRFAEPKRPAGTRSPEHIRIGWARVDGGVRVAHWPSGEVVVPSAILSQHEHAAAILSAADRHFVRAKDILRRWMIGGPHRLTAWHQMLSEQRRGMLRHACLEYAAWRLGAASLRETWITWREDRLSRGEDLYASPWMVRRWLSHRSAVGQEEVVAFWCYLWARKDAHLLQYGRDSARRFENRREDFFRREAIRIATEFESVTVDGYKIAAMKELPSLTAPGDMPRDQAQHNAQAAAPGRFRELLLDVMGPRCEKSERDSGTKDEATSRKRKVRAKGGDENDPKSVAAE